MIRFLLLGFVIYFGYRLARSIGLFSVESEQRSDTGHAPDGATELIRDPQCGVYFLKRRGVEAVIRGEKIHFCSSACRDDYIRANRSG